MSLGGAIANQAAALAPAQGRVERAEAAMAVYDARQAAEHARAASEIAEQISAAAGRFDSIQTGIGAEREASQAVVAQGYRLDRSEEALVASEAALASAADTLQSGDPAAATPHLDTAQAKLDEGVVSGSGAPALRERNERRLAETEARGKEASALITRGREAFDSVDEFAESTWSDIRGNGSEAQAAAGRAQRHWEVARQGNTMEEQAFFAASEQLDAAARELDFVDKLIDAILTRLKDLEAARDAARGLLDEAERSLNAALEFVRGNDPDVGQAPEVQLRDAAAQLKAAQAEAGQAKPDWLRLAAAATQADQLADAALAGARGEAETMAKLRQQAAQLRTVVSAEVSKIAKFVNVRGADITPNSLATVKTLVQRYEQAEALERRAAEVAEDERRKALQGAVAALTGLQEESGKVFGAVQADAKRLEELRGELTSALAGADSALDEAEALLLQAGGRAPGNARGRLSQARASFNAIHLPVSGEAALRQKTDQARGIANEARSVASEIRGRLTTHRPGGIGPVIITGGWGGNGSWGGGRGSGGGGGGGPHWGSFGGGGGSFGGGGGGGSFGGGGGGGGGW